MSDTLSLSELKFHAMMHNMTTLICNNHLKIILKADNETAQVFTQLSGSCIEIQYDIKKFDITVKPIKDNIIDNIYNVKFSIAISNDDIYKIVIDIAKGESTLQLYVFDDSYESISIVPLFTTERSRKILLEELERYKTLTQHINKGNFKLYPVLTFGMSLLLLCFVVFGSRFFPELNTTNVSEEYVKQLQNENNDLKNEIETKDKQIILYEKQIANERIQATPLSPSNKDLHIQQPETVSDENKEDIWTIIDD